MFKIKCCNFAPVVAIDTGLFFVDFDNLFMTVTIPVTLISLLNFLNYEDSWWARSESQHCVQHLHDHSVKTASMIIRTIYSSLDIWKNKSSSEIWFFHTKVLVPLYWQIFLSKKVWQGNFFSLWKKVEIKYLPKR